MTKIQGYGAIGALLVAGVMIRGFSGSGPAPSSGKPRDLTSISEENAGSDDGPWLASCRYWAGVAPTPSAGTASPQLNLDLNQTGTTFDATVSGSLDNSKTACEQTGNKWGIPSESLGKREIHAVIFTAPDPIHSHLALEFDRSIDSLLQAAADNKYLGSNYWLPWLVSSPSSQTQSTAAGKAAERKREEQPGLIILKYSPATDEPKDLGLTSYYRVVYIFLVGESPALGIDGNQLRNALDYEKNLRDSFGAALSMGDFGSNTLAFIGPRGSGSASSLRQALVSTKQWAKPPDNIIGAGTTSTDISSSELNYLESNNGTSPITYFSFGENTKFEEDRIVEAFPNSGSNAEDTAILVEDNTVFGGANAMLAPKAPSNRLYIRFPREISLLRNAQVEQNSSPSAPQTPSPYLSLSLKDPGGADDTIPKFSSAQTPLSQEAQLMAIERQLQKAHVQHILITASNILDEIFLARELARACPNANIVFYNGGDLLFERDVDNLPYIGSITVTPQSLVTWVSTVRTSNQSRRFFSDSQAAAVYNASSFMFWWGSDDWKNNKGPQLVGSFYSSPDTQQFPLIATAVGTDGYYPLGILTPCASGSPNVLPNIRLPDIKNHSKKTDQFACTIPTYPSKIKIPIPELPSQTPSKFWYLLCIFVIALSLIQAAVIRSANYWSPFARDLAIEQNDQPRRRAVYIHIGTSMLFSMSLILTVPWVAFSRGEHCWYFPAFIAATLTLAAAVIVAVSTLLKTHGYLLPPQAALASDTVRLYPWFNWMAAAIPIIVLACLMFMCLRKWASWGTSYTGLFFSYRCLYPLSGVSPVPSLLLLLFAWYVWAMFQARRLRFSAMNRPRLPSDVVSASSYPLFVSDQSLEECQSPLSSCLFQNIDCLLITRELARRFTGWMYSTLNSSLLTFYIVAFMLCALTVKIQSVDRFLLPGYLPTAYESLIAILLYPLFMIALAGWLRVLFIWSALKNSLLEQLERSPFRLAFSRLSEANWMAMLGQSGLNVRWRDMSRSTESLRQLMSNDQIREAAGAGWQGLKDAYDGLNTQITSLHHYLAHFPSVLVQEESIGEAHDLPNEDTRRDLCFVYAIERRFAVFCEHLLEFILIPYWLDKRVGFVSEVSPDGPGTRRISDAPQEPLYIRLAEEFLAIRYVALIRVVIVNIRDLMVFVAAAFVLALVAWNSYLFQPRQIIDWCFTILILCLGIGFIWVFAQMHRNPILSRITATTPNELGTDFYIRLATFGAIPVLTWLAYHFPEIGSRLFQLIQPSLQVAK